MSTKPKRKGAHSKDAPHGLTGPDIVKLAEAKGAMAAQIVSPSDVLTAEWARWKCRFGCDCYDRCLVCPPHTPTPSETRRMLDGYSRAVLFEGPDGEVKTIAFELERELFLSGYYKSFGLGAGPCTLCEACAMEEGCRHAERARPAMEAVGIDVFATAHNHGFDIDVVVDRADPQHYFGLVLVE